MPYRVNKNGEILCDTPEEAILLAKKMGGASTETVGPESTATTHSDSEASRWTESRYREFIGLLRGHQKPFIDLLTHNLHGKTDRAIRQSLGLESNMALAGVTAGLAKNAMKVGMSASEVFIKKKMNVGTERVLEYTLADTFRSIASRVPDRR